MDTLIRQPAGASKDRYDAIIVGGGVYGVMLALEMSKNGLRPLLLEQADFGQYTSTNSLRIVHGGFRYLQNLDVPRLLESSGERSFFLRTFPELVRPIDCLMPLYGEGLRRPSFLLVAQLVYHLLTFGKNKGVPPRLRIRKGRILSPSATRNAVPDVISSGLKGAVVWQDGFAPDSQRLLMESLRLAAGNGAVSLNYMQAEDLLTHSAKVAGVRALDRESGRHHEFFSTHVINASGPWCRELAARFHRDIPRLFHSALAWNVLFNRPAPANFALALAPRRPRARTYFLVPYKGRLFAGTGHATWPHAGRIPMPTRNQLKAFIDDLNEALPSLGLCFEDIGAIFPGLQPADRPGSAELGHREVMIDHGREGGPNGLYSISGVKFTTARKVAEKFLRRIFPDEMGKNPPRAGLDAPGAVAPAGPVSRMADRIELLSRLERIMRSNEDTYDCTTLSAIASLSSEESALHLEDLVVRRTPLWEDPGHALRVAPRLCQLLGWDPCRTQTEVRLLENHFRIVRGGSLL